MTALPFRSRCGLQRWLVLASLGLLMTAIGNVHSAPGKAISVSLSTRQKRSHNALWRELGSLREPSAAQLARLEKLLKAGAPTNVPDKSGLYPLMVAVADERLITLFLKYGANPRVVDKDGMTPLHIAAMMGAPGTAKKLLQAGALREARDKNGETPLMVGIFVLANIGNVRDLIAAGANLEARDRDGITALSKAAAMENGVPFLRLLLDSGAQIETADKDGTTPLMAAALTGHTDAVELLLERGANPNARDKNGSSALDAAQTFSLMALISAQNAGRKLTPAEQERRLNSERIIRMLKSRTRPHNSPPPRWKSNRWSERKAATEELGSSGNPTAVDALLLLLQDPKWMVREGAITGLGTLWERTPTVRTGNERKIVAALLACADSPLGSQRPALRIAVAETLARIDTEGARAALRPFLKDANDAVRLFTIQTAGHLKDAASLPVLRDLAQHDTATIESESISIAAASAISEIQSARGGTP